MQRPPHTPSIAIRALFWASAVLCALIGVAHTAFTFVAFHQLSQRALYFAGTGLGALLLALFNIALWGVDAPSRLSRYLLHTANFLMSIFAVVAAIVVSEPQAFVGAVGVWGLLTAGLLSHRGMRAATPNI